MIRILICDPASQNAINYLISNKIPVDYLPNISPTELLEVVSRYEGLVVRSRTKITKEVIEEGKNLKIVGRIGSGCDNIDIKTCRQRKITVINAPDANSQSVAELTITLIISLLRKLDFVTLSMKEGKWLKNEIRGEELSGKTVGIIGYGYVGKRVAEILSCFGCKLQIYSRSYQNCSINELFSGSDIITIHAALTKETEGMIGKELLTKMKKQAYLVNISRGSIIDEDALYNVLSKGKIAGAALDVFWQEPLEEGSKWRKLKNVILTPHIGAATIEALEKASMSVAEDFVRFFKGIKPLYNIKN